MQLNSVSFPRYHKRNEFKKQGNLKMATGQVLSAPIVPGCSYAAPVEINHFNMGAAGQEQRWFSTDDILILFNCKKVVNILKDFDVFKKDWWPISMDERPHRQEERKRALENLLKYLENQVCMKADVGMKKVKALLAAVREIDWKGRHLDRFERLVKNALTEKGYRLCSAIALLGNLEKLAEAFGHLPNSSRKESSLRMVKQLDRSLYEELVPAEDLALDGCSLHGTDELKSHMRLRIFLCRLKSASPENWHIDLLAAMDADPDLAPVREKILSDVEYEKFLCERDNQIAKDKEVNILKRIHEYNGPNMRTIFSEDRRRDIEKALLAAARHEDHDIIRGKMVLALRPYQEEIVDKVMPSVDKVGTSVDKFGPSVDKVGRSAIISAPTGSGTAPRVLFVVPRQVLVDQHPPKLNQMFANGIDVNGVQKFLRVNGAHGGEEEVLEKILTRHVTVVTPQILADLLLYSSRGEGLRWEEITMVIFDEIDRHLRRLLAHVDSRMPVVRTIQCQDSLQSHLNRMTYEAGVYEAAQHPVAWALLQIGTRLMVSLLDALEKVLFVKLDELRRGGDLDQAARLHSWWQCKITKTQGNMPLSQWAKSVSRGLSQEPTDSMANVEVQISPSSGAAGRLHSKPMQLRREHFVDLLKLIERVGDAADICNKCGVPWAAKRLEDVHAIRRRLLKAMAGSSFAELLSDEKNMQLNVWKECELSTAPDFEAVSPLFRVLLGQLQREFEKDSASRAIIFVEKRILARDLCAALCEHLKGYKPAFVTSANTNDGTSKLEQVDTIELFKMGRRNPLIATTVMDEGFDMPQVNMIISYDEYVSEQSFKQKAGRARANGKMVLITGDRKKCIAYDRLRPGFGAEALERAMSKMEELYDADNNSFSKSIGRIQKDLVKMNRVPSTEGTASVSSDASYYIECRRCFRVLCKSPSISLVGFSGYVCTDVSLMRLQLAEPCKPTGRGGLITVGQLKCSDGCDAPVAKLVYRRHRRLSYFAPLVKVTSVRFRRVLPDGQKGPPLDFRKWKMAMEKLALCPQVITSTQKDALQVILLEWHREKIGARDDVIGEMCNNGESLMERVGYEKASNFPKGVNGNKVASSVNRSADSQSTVDCSLDHPNTIQHGNSAHAAPQNGQPQLGCQSQQTSEFDKPPVRVPGSGDDCVERPGSDFNVDATSFCFEGATI